MKLLDLLTTAWAIMPEQLSEIQGIYAKHLHSEKIDIAAIEARLGRPLASEQQDYQIRQGGVAVLTLEGVMAPKANMFMAICGGVSTQIAGLQIESAIADPRVKSLVLAIDSPGGSVFGTPELAATVRELAAIKPIVTVSDATLASAAYWVGSAANAVYISGPTVQVGSIGVVASHSYNPQDKNTTTEITAGKYKRIASSTGPLSAEGQAYMQQQVDHLYRVFVETVAANRHASTEEVLEIMADGRVFIGQQAIVRGLVDGYATVDSMVEQLAVNPEKFTKRKKSVFAPGIALPKPKSVNPHVSQPSQPKKESFMDRKELEQQHPALFAQLQAEFTASGNAAGAAAERQRIADVRAQLLPGHEALIDKFAADGKTTGFEAAAIVLAAERTLRANAVAAYVADAPKPVPHAAAPLDKVHEKTKAQQAAEAQALSKSKGISVVAALKELGYA